MGKKSGGKKKGGGRFADHTGSILAPPSKGKTGKLSRDQIISKTK